MACLCPPRVRDGWVLGRTTRWLKRADTGIAITVIAAWARVAGPTAIRVRVAGVVLDGVATIGCTVEAVFDAFTDVVPARRWAGAAVLRTAAAMLTGLA